MTNRRAQAPAPHLLVSRTDSGYRYVIEDKTLTEPDPQLFAMRLTLVMTPFDRFTVETEGDLSAIREVIDNLRTRAALPDEKRAVSRIIPRNRKEFAKVQSMTFQCFVVSRDNNYRPVERPASQAWELLDGDPKARLLDLGGGKYKVERRPRPMWYELTRTAGDA